MWSPSPGCGKIKTPILRIFECYTIYYGNMFTALEKLKATQKKILISANFVRFSKYFGVFFLPFSPPLLMRFYKVLLFQSLRYINLTLALLGIFVTLEYQLNSKTITAIVLFIFLIISILASRVTKLNFMLSLLIFISNCMIYSRVAL